ncbi:MAG TPA: alpha/beta fold hydrolase [Candidatus Nanopelagicales bacterium]|jgi:pimeloyl-ACP methyl ester carboxylesterase
MMTILDRLVPPVAWCESGTGPLALFLHGLGGDRHSWDPQLAELADIRRCIAWDMPGYGASPGLPDSLDALADAAAALIVGVGAEEADVVGLSLGGMVAQHLALRHPRLVRTLTLLDTSPAFGLDGTTKEQWLATRVGPLSEAATPPDVARAIVADMVGPDCPDDVRAAVVRSMQAVPPASLQAACAALVEHDVRESLHQIDLSVLVMVGALDPETPVSYARAIADRIPGARLLVVEGAGHLLNLENPGRVNAELRALWTSSYPEVAHVD